jgi:flagellar hook-length control protein FliK
MALHPNTPVHSSAHASHAAHTHAAHAASKARAAPAAQEGEGGGFAAQLLKAQPAAAPRDAKAADAKPKAEAKKKPADDKEAKADADAQDGQDDKDGKASDAKAPPLDAAALLAMQQAPAPVAPATTSLADKSAAAGDHDEFATDPLGALRKAASAKPGKDDGRQALRAGAGTGPQAPSAFAAPDAAAKAAPANGDIAAALAKADGAVKAATEARDALAAMLPQPDPVTVQAGAVGAPAMALLDANPPAAPAPPSAPAQATLAMPPQAPAFAPALGQQIDVWMKGGVQHAEVQLSPQDLGPIRVRIEMEGAHARVQMSADVASTRDALQQAMPQLSAQLGEVGLSLTGGGVSDQPTFQQSQAQANADGGSGRAGRQGAGDGHAGGADAGLGDLAQATAARQQAQRRGLLDLYA